MEIGFDVIGDLFLSPDDEFNWDGKPTSLYCIVTGNVSNDMNKLEETLTHISECYKGIFYVSGQYEFEDCLDVKDRVNEINLICKRIANVASLWHHVVLLENIAILGCNGWIDSTHNVDLDSATELYFDDLLYMKRSITKLQKHGDVKSMIVVTNSVPKNDLYFGQIPESVENKINLDVCLENDTEHKITHWAFGSYGNTVDQEINGITYINNPYIKGQPYWPKRIKTFI